MTLPWSAPRSRSAVAALLLGALAACADTGAPRAERAAVEPPLAYQGKAYDLAGEVRLARTPPQELPGLKNVYRLSNDVVSGSEPRGEQAFRQLQAMGIHTILSVDGKTPDADTARRYGLRYVHIPIQYKGIAPEEMAEIAKTYRELDGPFYVHCFHGKHRGPAAAAVGRLVLDGTSREEALAEMRQWCGTSPNYEGLFASIAAEPIPDPRATAALDFDFPSSHPFKGIRGVMIPMPRAHDALEGMAAHGWSQDPEHPDADPVNEATIVHQLFEHVAELPEAQGKPADFQGWLSDARRDSADLADALSAARAGLPVDQALSDDARALADAAFDRLGRDCKSCHAVYRDN